MSARGSTRSRRWSASTTRSIDLLARAHSATYPEQHVPELLVRLAHLR
jgi:hypothetical protein